MRMLDAAKGRQAELRGAIPVEHLRGSLRQFIAIVGLLAVSLFLLAVWPAGIVFDRVWSAVLVTLLLGASLAIAWPILIRLAMGGHARIAVVLAFALKGFLLALLGWVMAGFDILGVGAWVFAALALTLLFLGVALLTAAIDVETYDRVALRPWSRRERPADADGLNRPHPGLLFVEINGLAEPILREAIAGGFAPTMARWVRSGRHHLVGWECDLSSQTSASQAGLLHGTNFNVPAFRWYDKATQTIVVSNHVNDGAATIEHQVSNGHGLLAGGGTCRGTLLSGDAENGVFTCSMVGAPGNRAQARVFGDLDLFGWGRLVVLAGGNVVAQAGRTVWGWFPFRRAGQASQRNGGWLFGRVFTTVILRELCAQTVIGDMIRGVPTVYVAFSGYDAVAHHTGIRSTDALSAIRGIDRQLKRLDDAMGDAWRAYEFVVLSGHGQSQGPTFRQRYGQSLAHVARDLLPDTAVLVDRSDADEAMETTAALLSEITARDTWYGRWLARALRERPTEATTISPETVVAPCPARREPTAEARQAIVLASGSLGLISFPAWPHRLSYEEITSYFPRLLAGLMSHAGIAFVLVTSAEHGAMVLGASGTYYLDDDLVEGDDPLAGFGPHAARHLRRESLFVNAPDILVNSWYDRRTDEVTSFEEAVGSHGGLGGSQAQPFLLRPSALRAAAEPLIGAGQVHELFTRWQRELASTYAKNATTGEPVR